MDPKLIEWLLGDQSKVRSIYDSYYVVEIAEYVPAPKVTAGHCAKSYVKNFGMLVRGEKEYGLYRFSDQKVQSVKHDTFEVKNMDKLGIFVNVYYLCSKNESGVWVSRPLTQEELVEMKSGLYPKHV